MNRITLKQQLPDYFITTHTGCPSRQPVFGNRFMRGKVKHIYISEAASKSMQEISSAMLIKNKGIKGDRYFSKTGTWSDKVHKPDFNLSLIEYEKIKVFQQQGIPLSPADYRRNIITTGISLNDLVNKQFMIGNALCLGIRLCEPCRYLEELTALKLVKPMAGKGGLRAQILTDGIVNSGALMIGLD